MKRKVIICGALFLLHLVGIIPAKAQEISKVDEVLLDEIESRCFSYFWNEANPKNGLIKDRYSNDKVCNISAVGFGLTGICLGIDRGWVDKKEAYERILLTLKTFRDSVDEKRGFFYRFINIESGKRVWDCELSPIDTAIFIAGALTAAQYFKGTEAEEIANLLYKRIDWNWMLSPDKTFYLSWHPHYGFSQHRWDIYNESVLLYILAIGSPAYPIPSESWHKIQRQIRSYGNYKFINSWPGGIFPHLYPQAWLDLKDKHDKYADYWVNSQRAIFANRQFCIDNRKKYRGYDYDCWGISASDGPEGYRNYGIELGQNDGTIAPYAVLASIPFVPATAMKAINYMKEKYTDKIWGKYGFTSGFNVDKKWFSRDWVGIDLGITMLMIENYRSSSVWKYFMKNGYTEKALNAVGFLEGTMSEVSGGETGTRLDISREEISIIRAKEKVKIDADLREWDKAIPYVLTIEKNRDYGSISGPDDLSPTFRFMWDDEYLYFAAEVIDNEIICNQIGLDIYKDDCVELFIDPQNDGLIWGDKHDFQIGFAPTSSKGKGQVYSWFQDEDPVKNNNIVFHSKVVKIKGKSGYIVEAAIKWSYLNLVPRENLVISISPAFHDVDRDGTNKKLNWSYKDPGIILGKAILIDKEF